MASMLAARLHGAKDLRLDQVAEPGPPPADHVKLRVTAVGVCGSDLHTYLDGRIGQTQVVSPVTLGHEFTGVVTDLGEAAIDGFGRPLVPGVAVAVDPAQPCYRCEMCEKGHPNLCWRLHFCGLFPDDGALCETMIVPARTCFSLPTSMSPVTGALLEPLGVASHATDLARVKLGDTAAVLGAGPIGLMILQTLLRSGARPVFVSDRHPWRLDAARRLGATPLHADKDPVQTVHELTGGRGVDVAIEAAWCDETAEQAAAMCRLGGRVVIVGISGNDTIRFSNATLRRKGLTIRMSRRMKHVYPRAISIAPELKLEELVSHRFRLEQAPEAFALNAAYGDEIIKAVIEHYH